MTHNHRGNKAISMLSGNIYWFLKHCYPFRTREYTKSAGIAYFYALSLEYLYPVVLPPSINLCYKAYYVYEVLDNSTSTKDLP